MPSGAIMSKTHSPPARRSIRFVRQENPSGPHHSGKVSGFIQAPHTTCRGALITRCITMVRSATEPNCRARRQIPADIPPPCPRPARKSPPSRPTGCRFARLREVRGHQRCRSRHPPGRDHLVADAARAPAVVPASRLRSEYPPVPLSGKARPRVPLPGYRLRRITTVTADAAPTSSSRAAGAVQPPTGSRPVAAHVALEGQRRETVAHFASPLA